MKTNDLMVGDLVSRKGKPVRVLAINEDNGCCVSFGNGWCGESVDLLEPIPLTPEILEKNGFEDTIGDAFWISTSCNLLWKDGKLQNFCREEDDEVCIPCEYVHELQHALRLCKVDKEIVL